MKILRIINVHNYIGSFMDNFFRQIIITFLIIIFYTICVKAQKVNMTFQIDGYNNDTLLIAYYYGNRTLVKDTILRRSDKKGLFRWAQDTLVPQGVYLALMKPNNNYVQFLVNDRQNSLKLKFHADDLSNVDVAGCKENKAFFEFLTYLGEKRVARDTLNARLERAINNNLPQEHLKDDLSRLDQEVKLYQQNILRQFPGTVLDLLISSNMEVEVPEYAGDEKSVQTQKYLYYKNHYFDQINFLHPALIRTPTIQHKVDDYLNRFTVQIPDSLIITVDYILKLTQPNKDAFQYFLSESLNKFAQSNYVGHIDIAVHIIDNYYAKGLAHWVAEENIEKLKSDADNIRPTMLGKKMPDITTYLEDNTPVRLYDITSDYVIVFLWDPDCATCKKFAPEIVNFQKKHSDERVKILTICNQPGEKFKNCWTVVKEKGMDALINTGDEYQRYQSKIRNTKVPKILILDKDKKIILKDFAADKLDEIFENLVKETDNRIK